MILFFGPTELVNPSYLFVLIRARLIFSKIMAVISRRSKKFFYTPREFQTKVIIIPSTTQAEFSRVGRR